MWPVSKGDCFVRFGYQLLTMNKVYFIGHKWFQNIFKDYLKGMKVDIVTKCTNMTVSDF